MSISLFILLANVLVSFSAFNNRDLFFKLDFQPYQITRSNEWYRFISHAFVHADYYHLLINMYVLYNFGEIVEVYYEKLFGELWIPYFITLYLGGILFSTIPGYARNKDNYNYHGVGASGAVSAVVYSFILINPMAELRLFLIPIGMPAAIFGLLYLVFEIYSDRNRQSHIAHSAHYFGGLYGLLLTAILAPDLVTRWFL